MPVGLPDDPNAAIGPLISEKQRERVESYIKKGVDEGARLVTGVVGSRGSATPAPVTDSTRTFHRGHLSPGYRAREPLRRGLPTEAV